MKANFHLWYSDCSDVSNNQIDGPLPDSVGDMTALVTL